ncbi:MAG: M12 family metallopeptidase, partial [Planctomycetota bacterium]|nr:M12 family metallopeptidase [Planctomycetota bacterium]
MSMIRIASLSTLIVLAGTAAAQESLIGMGKAAVAQATCGDEHGQCPDTCTIMNAYGDRGVWHDVRWPGGIVYYDFSVDVTTTQQGQARAAMDVIESWTDLTFVPRTDQANFVHIIPANGNYSYVGMIGGSQELGLFNWSTQAVVIHELMHATGVWHEQSRSDRDNFVEVNWDAIQAGYAHNFDAYATEPLSGSHDFDSVMHYGPTGFSINGDRTLRVRPLHARAFQYVIGQRTGMSNGDIWTLTEMYGGQPPARNFALSLPANGSTVGAAWNPSFSWTPSQDATQYTLKVDDDPAFGSPAINTNLTTTTYTSLVPLAAGRLYYWTVTSSNARGTGKPSPVATHAFYTDSTLPSIIYVDASAPAGGNGRSWATAMRDLQDALSLATYFGNAVNEVRIARGTYKPDRGTLDRTMSFWLANSVTVRGGYAGRTSTTPDANNPALYTTILSGDLSSNDGANFTNNADNSYNVVTGSWTDSSAVLERVTVRGGNANSGSFPRSRGGALQVDTGSPILRECIFELSQSTALFGGVSLSYGGTPRFESCTFQNMRTTGASPNGTGGLIGIRHKTNATFDRCTLSGGTARIGAGAYVLDASPTFTSSVIRANTASELGGALHAAAGSTVGLYHLSTFGNTASSASGALHVDANASIVTANSIFWGDVPAETLVDAAGSLTASYSILQGGYPGTGNLAANPLYEAPGSGNLAVQPASRAIDSGDNSVVTLLGL